MTMRIEDAAALRPKLVAALIAALVVVGAFAVAWPAHGFAGLLVAALYGIGLALGASIFMAVNGVAGAHWWYPLAPIATGLAKTLAAPAAALGIVVAFGLPHVYEWAGPHGHGHAMPHDKAVWLSAPFFAARAALIVLAWLLIIAWLARSATAAATSRDPNAKGALARTSAIFIVIFGPTVTLAFFDWGMSLEPAWVSTMYGVYGFAGAFQAALAAMAVLMLVSPGGAGDDARVRHDLGKLLFGFSMFWGYIWLSQFLLIWYANLPEEVPHYIRRQSGDWAFVFWLDLVLCFGVPFFGLLSARAKKNRAVLLQVAITVLVGRWLDIYQLVVPATEATPSLPYAPIAATVAVVSAMSLLLLRARRAPAPTPVPV